MKKSVVLTIGIIYLFAIVIVGFIGIKMKVYNANVYVESIECISSGYTEYKEGSLDRNQGYSGYISTKYEKGLVVLLKCKIFPENATEKDLEYIYDKNQSTYKLVVNDDGTASVMFLKGGNATITIRATDNVHKEIKIKIIAIDLEGIL